MPNDETMVATNTALLFLPQLPLAARKCDVVPALQQPLLSLGHLCDEGFTATLDSETSQLTKDSITTMSGTRDHTNGIYFTPYKDTPTHPPPTYNVPTCNVHTN